MSEDANRASWKRWWWSVPIMLLLAYCCRPPEATSTPGEAKALAIAKAAIADHPELHDYRHFDKPSGNPVTGRWSVAVWREPQVPGGYVTVEIDRNGKVTAIMGGL
jgi:hypothetical protein